MAGLLRGQELVVADSRLPARAAAVRRRGTQAAALLQEG